MLTKMAGLVNRLTVNEENMRKNLGKTNGIIFSQRVLLELIKKGFTRVEAYDIAQAASFSMREEDIDFRNALKRNKKVRERMSSADIEECFDLGYHTKHVDKIFKKAGI